MDLDRRVVRPCLSLTTLAMVALALPGCSGSGEWHQTVVSIPLDADEVVAAVASLPECREALSRGGVIRWQPLVRCNGTAAPVWGCSYPTKDPPEVDVTYRQSAWNGPPEKPDVSTLAHELCHVCGYTDQVGDSGTYEPMTDACALRARVAAGK